jgi:hypothetical protein
MHRRAPKERLEGVLNPDVAERRSIDIRSHSDASDRVRHYTRLALTCGQQQTIATALDGSAWR